MTFSFLWWLYIVKAPNVKKKKRKKEKEKRLVHATNTLLIEVAFIFVCRF